MSAESTSPITDKLPEQPLGQAFQAEGGECMENDAERLQEHAQWLRRLIERRVRPLDCSDEVLQEVFVAASRSQDLPQEPQAQQPWLARVAIRQCALALRSWCRRRRRETEYAVTRYAAEEPLAEDPIYWLLLSERREFVRDQLARLEPSLRELLVLKYVKGCTYKEISERLRMEVAAVEYRLAEARKKMRQRLVEAGFDEGRDDG